VNVNRKDATGIRSTRRGALRALCLVVAGFSFIMGTRWISVACAAGTKTGEPPTYWGNILSPGQHTNLFYRCRGISNDGKTLTQTRYWLLGTRIRLLDEDLPNETQAMSVTNVPEDTWARARRVLEIVKNDKGFFCRQRSDTNWNERARQERATAYKRNPKSLLFLTPPENWSPIQDVEGYLYEYRFIVDDRYFAAGQLSSSSPMERELTIRLPDYEGRKNRVLTVKYDPVTNLKIREQEWAGTSLVRDCSWKTNEWIDSKQFIITEADLFKRFPSGTKLGVVGLRLQPSERGPYVIEEVIANSPAAEAGIKAGDTVVGVDGKDVRAMSLQEVVDAVRGDPGSPINVEIEQSSTKEKKTLELYRRLVIHPSKSLK
jgi:hypothetical protein